MGREISDETRRSDRAIANFLNLFDMRQTLYKVGREIVEGMLEDLAFLLDELSPSGFCRDEAQEYIKLGAEYFSS